MMLRSPLVVAVLVLGAAAQDRVQGDAFEPWTGFRLAHPECICVQYSPSTAMREAKGATLDAAGYPLPQVTIEFRPDGQKAPIREISSNRQGEFRLKLPPGRYQFKTTKDGFKSVFGRVVIQRKGEHGVMTLRLEPGF